MFFDSSGLKKHVMNSPEFARRGSVIQNNHEQVRGYCSPLPPAYARAQGGSESHDLSPRLYTSGICSSSSDGGGGEEEGGGGAGGSKGTDVHGTDTRGAAVHVQGGGRRVLLQKT